MAKKGKRPEEGQYAPLAYSLIRSPAWRSLSGPAIKVWIELHSRYNGSNNGKLFLSLNEAAEILGMGKATAQRAFAELSTKGFTALVTEGNWYSRKAHEWRITTKPMETPKGRILATNDWHQWRPKKQNAVL